MANPEPKRQTDLAGLKPAFRAKVVTLLDNMQAKGWDPVVFEARRSAERQAWLYGISRTHHLKSRPVTWTRTSKHQAGVAVDIISQEHGWSNHQFFDALKREAVKLALHDYRGGQDFDKDCAHIQE